MTLNSLHNSNIPGLERIHSGKVRDVIVKLYSLAAECAATCRRTALALAAFACVGTVQAQVPPSESEAALYTGLHAAAWQGNHAAVAGAGAQALEARDKRGRTPLHVATFARRRDTIRALVTAGADLGALENDRYDAVTIAAVADDEETLAVLLELGASASLVTSRYDGTALIAAAHLGHDGVVRQLIAAGAPLDHVNNLQWTALIEAVVLGDGGARHQATAKALVDAGADVSIADGNGRTPLELARAYGFEGMVGVLEGR